jgi:hypothetical protein
MTFLVFDESLMSMIFSNRLIVRIEMSKHKVDRKEGNDGRC